MGCFVRSEHDVHGECWPQNHCSRLNVLSSHLVRQFFGATAFNQNLSNWNVSRVQRMNSMFRDAMVFQGHGLEHWDVSNVVSMESMFDSAVSFQGNLSAWYPVHVADFSWQFYACALFVNDLSTWRTTSATTMQGMVRDHWFVPKALEAVIGSLCVCACCSFMGRQISAPIWLGGTFPMLRTRAKCSWEPKGSWVKAWTVGWSLVLRTCHSWYVARTARGCIADWQLVA